MTQVVTTTEIKPEMRNELAVFSPSEVGTLGNKFLVGILAHEMAIEAAKDELAQGEKRDNFIDFELTKAVLFLHMEEKVDLYKIYGDKKSSELLYRSILTELGVLVRKITDDDNIIYEYTDPALKDQFFLDGALKEKNEAEYLRRRSRRNSLNLRLARVVKAGITLHDAKATPDDMTYKTDEAGVKTAVISKGPAIVMGKEKEVSINSDARKPLEGAKFSPSITGLAKAADSVHKTEPASKTATETTSKKKGDSGTSEEDFLATVNAVLAMVKSREGKFSKAEETVLKNLAKQITADNIKH